MFTLNQLSLIKLEQIANDLKSGIPVIYNFMGQDHLLLALESLNGAEFVQLKDEAKDLKLIITKDRMKYVGIETIDHVLIDINNYDFNKILGIAGIDNITSADIDYLSLSSRVNDKFNDILNFAIFFELIPALILLKPNDARICYNFHHLDQQSLANYQTLLSNEFIITAQAELKISITDNKVKLYSFRSKFGTREHYAIIVGEIGVEPLVRLHSSCYTGDLLSSISCDCYDQFHLALTKMAENQDGGILLYLIQEGRGIGLVNKLRAYNLQSQGLDTMDANIALGFPDDARILWPAARILELLGVSQIKLLTNNPKKVNELTKLGINVIDIVKHHVELNGSNQQYMQTKIDKMGHIN